MSLSLISIGIYDKKDICLRAIEEAKNCDVLYFENYTSFYGSDLSELEEIFSKRIVLIDRERVESDFLIKEAANKKVGLLIIGDALSATTHISLITDCSCKKIPVKIIHGSSVFSAAAETGLSLYNFGRTISIPFDNSNLKKPYEDFLINSREGMHTLFLLDLKNGNYMSIKEALEYLVRNGLDEERICIGCAALGSDSAEIKAGKVKEIINSSFIKEPRCLIIPGKLQFYEEEALKRFII